ncbi:hypothetical protein, partial [Neolewinella litorea]
KEMTAKDAKRLLVKLYARYRKGEVTEAAAYREAFLINSIVKAIEVTDLESRLDSIEQTLTNG